MEADQALAESSAVSAVPVFGLFDSELGEGIVGGPLVPMDAMARDAADAAVQLLQGTPAGSSDPPTVGPGVPRFDARQLERWNITETALPEGSIIEFREPSAWDHYHWQIITVLTTLVVQAALILALLVNRRRLQRSKEMLHHSEERLSLAADAATLGLWDLNIDASEMWLSDTCRRLLGLKGRVTLEDFVAAADPPDQAVLRSAILRAKTGVEDFEAEYRLRDNGGEPRWLATRGRLERGSPGRPSRLRRKSRSTSPADAPQSRTHGRSAAG